MNFSPMTIGEVLPKGFDLVRNIKSGETISSVTFSVAIIRGTNASSTAMVSGSPAISGTKVSQKIAALVVGYYEIRAQVLTSDGNTYIERGTLEVVA